MLFNACWSMVTELRDRVTFHTLFMKPAPEMPLIEKCPGLSGKNYGSRIYKWKVQNLYGRKFPRG